jgi:tRNA modification GTPase
MSLPQNRDPDKRDSATFDRGQQSLSPRPCAAVLTGPGRSAVAVIGLQGAGAQTAMAHCFTPVADHPWSVGDIRFGQWCADLGPDHAESVVVTPLADEAFEIHCHGGPAAITRITQDLACFGVETIAAEQCVRHPSEPLIIREAARVLAACPTARTAAVALYQVRGALRDWAIQQQAMWNQDRGSARNFSRKIDRLLLSAELGLRLAEPQRVVLSGPPNVGKSSLINAIVGYDRSITFDQPGTTRDVLHTETVIDGIPIRLSDTAGIHSAADPLEREGILRACDAIESADLVIRVTQPGLADDWDRQISRSIEVLNKADLAGPDFGPNVPDPSKHRTVAVTGQGVPELMRVIVAELSGPFPAPGQPVPLTERQVQVLNEMKRTGDGQQIRELLDRLINGR